MNEVKQKSSVPEDSWPARTGYRTQAETLCIGLDVAWFGGSHGDPASRFDFLAAALLDDSGQVNRLDFTRVPLQDRDPDANLIFSAVNQLIQGFGNAPKRIVLAIDAPLQAEERGLPERQPKPQAGQVALRACDRHFSDRRKSIDQACGGSNRWHPNIQPGAPLASRIKALLSMLVKREFTLWSPDTVDRENLIIECFPAEEIWAAKRMNFYPDHFTASRAKDYKAQHGCLLTESQLRTVIGEALCGFIFSLQSTKDWTRLVEELLNWVLSNDVAKQSVYYRGGKLLDDVVDSVICLSTSLCYANNMAHVWQDLQTPNDGHIIGPGRMR